MNPSSLPIPLKNVMITYMARVCVNYRWERYESQRVTRRAFYVDSDGYYDLNNKWVKTPNGFYHVPQYWREVKCDDGTIDYIPNTMYHLGRVPPNGILWEYCK